MAALFCLSVEGTALACSRAAFVTDAGDVFVGRNQDWTEKVNSTFNVFPRSMERVGSADENPLTWTSKFGSLVITGYDTGTHEGVNEAGLAAHQLFLAQDLDFGERDLDRPGLGIMMQAQYMLDSFATVAEAVAAIEASDTQIVPLILPNGEPTDLHLSLTDATGDSAIIEYTKEGGHPRIYHDRRFVVMTNEPTFDRQIENLRQYRGFGGEAALPGERTPADRFVRAAYYVNALPEPETRDIGVAYTMSVMRNVSVPHGSGEPGKPNVANTIFRSVQDLDGQRYFFESTFAPNVVWVDWSELDFSEGAPELELRVEERILSLTGDVTDELVPPAEPFDWALASD
ncbi:linear amide C-N hydrolase [Acuticoccus sp.]|uniref:linear amide C-N hydrolase n=1 Tax=Acuticoccus sp. TaxID=1904378 RepID=UPI003B52A330